MLETIRKHHYVLMCIIAVVVIIAFTFLYDPNQQQVGSGARVGTLYGRDFTAGEKRGIDEMQAVAGRLASMIEGNDFMARYADPATRFVSTIGSVVNRYTNTSRASDEDLDFTINVLILREEAKRLGIAADKDDVARAIQELGAFKTAGRFDSTKFDSFLAGGALGDRTTTERKLFTFVHDMILFQKLSRLVGGTFAPSPAEVDDSYASQHVKTTAAYALVEKAKFAEQTVTDEEAAKFHEAEKAKMDAPPAEEGKSPAPSPDPIVLSDEKRSVKYVFAAKPKPPTAPTPPVQEDLSTITDEAQKKAREEAFKKQQEEYTKLLDEHTKAMEKHAEDEKAWLKKVDDFANALVAEDRNDNPFEEIAKAIGFESKTAEFTKAAPPEDLKPEEAAVAAIFTAEPGQVDAPVQTANGWCLFEVATVTKASVLPLDQVKEKIVGKLKADKTTNALKEAADKARTAIADAVKAGKSFKEAATAAGLTPVDVPTFSPSKPPTGVANQNVVLEKARALNAGELSEAADVPEGLLLVFVEKKELPNDPKMEEDKKNLAKNLAAGDNGSPFSMPSPLFQAWFTARRDAASEAR